MSKNPFPLCYSTNYSISSLKCSRSAVDKKVEKTNVQIGRANMQMGGANMPWAELK